MAIEAISFPDQPSISFSCQIKLCDKGSDECRGMSPPACTPLTQVPITGQVPMPFDNTIGNTFGELFTAEKTCKNKSSATELFDIFAQLYAAQNFTSEVGVSACRPRCFRCKKLDVLDVKNWNLNTKKNSATDFFCFHVLSMHFQFFSWNVFVRSLVKSRPIYGRGLFRPKILFF